MTTTCCCSVKYFPWLEDTYQALPGDIYRVDLVRNMYMYIFGGRVDYPPRPRIALRDGGMPQAP